MRPALDPAQRVLRLPGAAALLRGRLVKQLRGGLGCRHPEDAHGGEHRGAGCGLVAQVRGGERHPVLVSRLPHQLERLQGVAAGGPHLLRRGRPPKLPRRGAPPFPPWGGPHIFASGGAGRGSGAGAPFWPGVGGTSADRHWTGKASESRSSTRARTTAASATPLSSSSAAAKSAKAIPSCPSSCSALPRRTATFAVFARGSPPSLSSSARAAVGAFWVRSSVARSTGSRSRSARTRNAAPPITAKKSTTANAGQVWERNFAARGRSGSLGALSFPSRRKACPL